MDLYLPIIIDFLLEGDHVALLEAELARVLRLEVIERLAGWLGQLGGCGAGCVAGRGRHTRVEARAEGRRPAPMGGCACGGGAGTGGDQGSAWDVTENVKFTWDQD